MKPCTWGPCPCPCCMKESPVDRKPVHQAVSSGFKRETIPIKNQDAQSLIRWIHVLILGASGARTRAPNSCCTKSVLVLYQHVGRVVMKGPGARWGSRHKSRIRITTFYF